MMEVDWNLRTPPSEGQQRSFYFGSILGSFLSEKLFYAFLGRGLRVESLAPQSPTSQAQKPKLQTHVIRGPQYTYLYFC